MSRQVALLRGVNLGGRKVVMSELRAACERAGFTDVETLIASGNLVLGSKLKGEKLEKKLEAVILEELSLKTDVHVRDAAQLFEDHRFELLVKLLTLELRTEHKIAAGD